MEIKIGGKKHVVDIPAFCRSAAMTLLMFGKSVKLLINVVSSS